MIDCDFCQGYAYGECESCKHNNKRLRDEAPIAIRELETIDRYIKNWCDNCKEKDRCAECKVTKLLSSIYEQRTYWANLRDELEKEFIAGTL